MTDRYNEFGSWLAAQLGGKAQKISVNAGFSCPNRDGRVGTGGCAYCDNVTFNPSYCDPLGSISLQLEAGKRFFRRKYPDMKFLAYFQAFTNTYAPVSVLRRKYEEALTVEGVAGLVVSTRPDCLPPDVLDLLDEMNRRTFLLVELGIETTNDALLQRVARGHDFDCVREIVTQLAARGIRVGGHLIFGLPGIVDWSRYLCDEAARLNTLPLTTLKIHQLQIVKGTRMAVEYANKPWPLPSVDEYIDRIVDFVRLIRPSFVLERFVSQSPPRMLAVPGWGLKNYEFTARLLRRMDERDARQGQLYSPL